MVLIKESADTNLILLLIKFLNKLTVQLNDGTYFESFHRRHQSINFCTVVSCKRYSRNYAAATQNLCNIFFQTSGIVARHVY